MCNRQLFSFLLLLSVSSFLCSSVEAFTTLAGPFDFEDGWQGWRTSAYSCGCLNGAYYPYPPPVYNPYIPYLFYFPPFYGIGEEETGGSFQPKKLPDGTFPGSRSLQDDFYAKYYNYYSQNIDDLTAKSWALLNYVYKDETTNLKELSLDYVVEPTSSRGYYDWLQIQIDESVYQFDGEDERIFEGREGSEVREAEAISLYYYYFFYFYTYLYGSYYNPFYYTPSTFSCGYYEPMSEWNLFTVAAGYLYTPLNSTMLGNPNDGSMHFENSFVLSPYFSLPGGGEIIYISFDTINSEETGYPCQYDVEYIEIELNGGTWQYVVGEVPELHYNTHRTPFHFDIPYISLTPGVARIRFRYDTGDACCGYTDLVGWYLDNIVITASGIYSTGTVTVTPSASMSASISTSLSSSTSVTRTPSTSVSRTSSTSVSRTSSTSLSSSSSASATASPSKSTSKTSSVTTSKSSSGSNSPSESHSTTPSKSASHSRTGSRSQSVTRSSTPSRTANPTNTATSTNTQTPTPTSTNTPSNSGTTSPTSTQTSTATPSETSSMTPSPSSSLSATTTTSASTTPTVTPSSTLSATTSPTNTLSATTTTSNTVSPTSSPTSSNTVSPTPSSTVSADPTTTPTPTSTGTPTKAFASKNPSITPSKSRSRDPLIIAPAPSALPTTLASSLPIFGVSRSPVSMDLTVSRTPSRFNAVQVICADASVSCDGGSVPVSDGGDGGTNINVVDDSGDTIAKVNVPDGVLVGTGSLSVQVIDIPDSQGIVDSSVVDINLYDEFGRSIDNLDEPIEICITSDSSYDPNEYCLGFWDTTKNPPKWECEDKCLDGKDGEYCGESEHLTSFALLLDSGGGDGCDDDDTNYAIAWASLAVVGYCYCCVVLAIILIEIHFFLKRRQKDHELRKTLSKLNSSELGSEGQTTL